MRVLLQARNCQLVGTSQESVYDTSVVWPADDDDELLIGVRMQDFFFGLFPTWSRRIKFLISTFSGLVLLLSLLVSPSYLFL